MLAALAAAASVVTLAYAQTGTGTDKSADQAAIRKLAEEYAAAWNSGNARQAALLFAQDGSFTEVSGVTHQGRAAIESDMISDGIGTAKTGTTLSIGMNEVRFLGPNLAVATGTTRFSGGAQPGGGHYLSVVRKVGGEWKIAAVHTAINPPSQPAVATASAAPQPTATSGSSASEEEAVLSFEREWTEAMIGKDAAALDRILADDFTEIDPMGMTHTKEAALANAKSGDLVFESFTPRDMKARVYGDTAVVTGLSTVKGTHKGQDISGDYRFTDTLVKRNGRWQAVASQATGVMEQQKEKK
jgi:uncharacterized protein (TIGR02246 family)